MTNKTHIDWLHATFATPAMSVNALVAMLGHACGRPVDCVQDRGLLGFETSVKLFAHHGSMKSPIGFLAYGGDSQRGRMMLQLTGFGCSMVKDWPALQELLEGLESKLTRVDVALDLHDGERSVEEAVSLYQAGGFNSGGRQPSSSLAGDWLNESKGRTLYVGKSTNGKMLRCYEKGRQLGDAESKWVRFEVQFGNRDRFLPHSMLTDSDTFFAGAYPCLGAILAVAATRIPIEKKVSTVGLAHLVFHMRRCYGRVLDVLEKGVEVSSSTVAAFLTVPGLPRRLNISSVEAGVTWDDVCAQVNRIKRNV